jgi:SulP family sulfate permease
LASYIPLATLAGVLAVVAWGMAEQHEFARIIRAWGGEALVLLATFLLTIFIGLAEGIAVGALLSALIFICRRRLPRDASPPPGNDETA